jgi:hypothetical protein
MTRPPFAPIALLCVLALAACDIKTKGGNASAASGGPAPAAAPAAAANAPLYPDWAQAVVAPYPNASVGVLVNQSYYQLQSPDDPATVAAWYKSHVNGAWTSIPNSGATSVTVGSVQITVSPNPDGSGGGSGAKTMIAIDDAWQGRS